jgi:hypothetical protein
MLPKMQQLTKEDVAIIASESNLSDPAVITWR